LRTGNGAPIELLQPFPDEVSEFLALGLLEQSNGCLKLTRAGKLVADSVAEAFV
jgi:coproporphyrinogen III oxidase-like Fe-S oxidoreductase